MELNYTENVKRLLKEKNIQVKDIANALGIAKENASRLINQDLPTLKTVVKLAEILNVDISEILFGPQDPEPPKHICPHCGKEIKIKLE